MNIPQEIINNIIIDYQDRTIHLDTIVEKYNITRFQIMQICDEFNVPRRRKNTKMNFSQEILDEILKDYNDMVPTRVISKKYGISLGCIYRLTRKENIDAFILKNRLEYKAEKAVELYDQGLAVRVIAEQISMTGKDVAEAIRQSGRDIRPIAHYSRKFKINSDYFENIDSHTKAQVLGMLWADGNVNKECNTLKLGITHTDKEYLQCILNDMGSDHLISTYGEERLTTRYQDNKELSFITRPVSIFNIVDRKICGDLYKLGVVPNKTYMNCNVPNIDDEYYGGWLLGLIEGDGCIQFGIRPSRKEYYHQVTMLVQQKAGEYLRNFLRKHDIDCHLYQRPQYKNNLWLLNIGKINSLIKLYHLLYDNAQFVMIRKHNKFKSMLEYFKIKKRPNDIGTLHSFE